MTCFQECINMVVLFKIGANYFLSILFGWYFWKNNFD